MTNDATMSDDAVNELVDALLTRSIPESIRIRRLPRKCGAWVESLEIDHDGYPSEEQLESIPLIGSNDAQRWMSEMFVPLAESIPCVSVSSKPATDICACKVTRIEFSTGGWSGAESFVYAVLDNFWLKQTLLTTRRGGHYVFEVPA